MADSNIQSDPNSRETQYGEFVSLLARHDQAIRRFIRSLLLASEGVDDVMQNTALECWKKFAEFAPATSEDAATEFIRWACVIARYKVLSWQRDHARDRLVFRESIIDKLTSTALDQVERQDEEKRAVESCLGQLPEDQRRLVLSVYSPGESIARIAAETGEKARRLYNRLNTLRKQLLNCVQQKLAGGTAHE